MNVLIVGGGQAGCRLAAQLLDRGDHVKVIDTSGDDDAHLVDLPASAIIAGSGTDPEVLEQAGIRQADAIAAVTGIDETNLVVTSLARFEFQVPHTLARVNDPAHAWLFTPMMGVDLALNQADLMANLFVEALTSPPRPVELAPA